jgi:hypothetical protein
MNELPGRVDPKSLAAISEIRTKGIKVSDDEMASINIKGDAFHPEWNYTISPSVPP